MSRLRIALAAALLALAAVTRAEAACEAPGWNVVETAALLEKAASPTAFAGLDRDKAGALTLTLAPFKDARLAMPPERAPKDPASFAATLAFGSAATGGAYRIALSDAAWIDVIQHDAYLKPAAFTGLHDCPGLRKIVAFEIGPEPFVLQLSDAASPSISVAIIRAK